MRALIGLDQTEKGLTRIFDRLDPLRDVSVKTKLFAADVKMDVPADSKEIHINWNNPRTKSEGEILLYMADYISSRGLLEGRPRFVSTYVEVDRMSPSPLEGLTAMLSTIATLNRSALEIGGFQHVEVANQNTSPVFEVLRKIGLYGYADTKGNRVENPVKTPHGVIYSAELPISRLDALLKKFVIQDGVTQLSNLVLDSRSRF